MTITLNITKIGNSEGVIFPKEVLAKLRVSKGDQIHLSETPDGFQIRPYDAGFERIMEAAEIVMREHRDVLKKLAE